MNKEQYLRELERGLGSISKKEKDKCLEFYEEIIEDYKEDGISEQDAIAKLDSPGDAAYKYELEQPLSKIIGKRLSDEHKRIPILLIILGFPLWFPLMIAFFAIIFSLFVSLWSIMVALYAVAVGLFAGGVGAVLYMPFLAFLDGGLSVSGFAFLGAGFVITALALVFWGGIKYPQKALLKLNAIMVRGIKKLFIRKSEVA